MGTDHGPSSVLPSHVLVSEIIELISIKFSVGYLLSKLVG
jgi:hypothetical protein